MATFRAATDADHVNVLVCLKLVVLMTLGSPPEILRIATRVPLYQGLVLIGSV